MLEEDVDTNKKEQVPPLYAAGRGGRAPCSNNRLEKFLKIPRRNMETFCAAATLVSRKHPTPHPRFLTVIALLPSTLIPHRDHCLFLNPLLMNVAPI